MRVRGIDKDIAQRIQSLEIGDINYYMHYPGRDFLTGMKGTPIVYDPIIQDMFGRTESLGAGDNSNFSTGKAGESLQITTMETHHPWAYYDAEV